MKKWIIRLVVLFIAATVGLLGISLYKNITIPKKVHYHAGFVVFSKDKKIDFSDVKYMTVKPCTKNKNEDDASEGSADIQNEKAHLHDYVGDVVHIERTGATWKDLFTNLHYSLDYQNATAYLNGKPLQNFQNQPIHSYDSIVILVGKNNVSKDLSQSVTKSHIQQEEKKSEDCG